MKIIFSRISLDRRLAWSAISLLLVVLGGCCWRNKGAETLTSSRYARAKDKYICKNEAIDPGYVIVGEIDLQRCPKVPGAKNAWIIRKPGKEEHVCWNSPIPSEYVTVGHTHSVDCPSQPDNHPNQKIIKLPGNEEHVCFDSHIPPGYTVVGTETSVDCEKLPDNQPNKKIIRKGR